MARIGTSATKPASRRSAVVGPYAEMKPCPTGANRNSPIETGGAREAHRPRGAVRAHRPRERGDHDRERPAGQAETDDHAAGQRERRTGRGDGHQRDAERVDRPARRQHPAGPDGSAMAPANGCPTPTAGSARRWRARTPRGPASTSDSGTVNRRKLGLGERDRRDQAAGHDHQRGLAPPRVRSLPAQGTRDRFNH